MGNNRIVSWFHSHVFHLKQGISRMQTFIKRNVPSHIIIKKSLLTVIVSIHQTNHHSITQSQHPAVTLLATVPTAAHTLLQQHAARLPVLTGSPCLHM